MVGRSRRHAARTTPSSMAREAPWPEEGEQPALPLPGAGGGALFRRDRGAGDVGEPDGAPGGVEAVAEEGAPAEVEVPGLRLGRESGVGRVTPEVGQADV